MNNFTAKTMAGLEEVLAGELQQTGAQNIKTGIRSVTFQGDQEVMYKANYLCRTALRILQPIASFSINTQQQLYNKVFDIAWEDIFGIHQTFALDGFVHESVFTHSKFAALRAKDAIADRFRKKFNQRPSVDPESPDVRINIHLSKNLVTVSLDSSGSSLHKRGYRTETGPAPLNEVLAAGMVLLSGWDRQTDFYDPMCGSGTILIEAAMLAGNIPAGYYRKKYGFENWNNFNSTLWDKIKREAASQSKPFEAQFFGSDISSRAIEHAIQNAKNAGLNETLSLKRRDFFKLVPQSEQGFIISNPPYDERMEEDDIIAFYRSIGDALKNNFNGFTGWLLSGNLDAIKKIGLKSSKRIILYNGPIESRFSKYELYKGTKRF
jgi:putative N6-adenine-specific DNA methylase